MNTERWIYLDSINHLTRLSPAELTSMAVNLLAQWSENAEASDLARAACYYLTHFVIPSAQGDDLEGKTIPPWVDELLFHYPPDEIENLETWLNIFPNAMTEALNERVKMGSEVIEKVTAEKIELAKQNNYGIYFTPNSMTGTKISLKGSRRLDENVGVFNAFFLDFDDEDKDQQRKKLRAYPVQPSYAVESKRGFQPYWLIRGNITENEWHSGMQRLIKFFGSDRAASNPSRLMRLPFTWHTKTDEKFLVKVEVWSARKYDWSEVLRPLPLEERRTYAFSAPILRSYLPTLTPNVLTPNERHPTLKEEAARLYAKQPRGKAQQIREEIVRWYEMSCQPLKPHWNQEVNDYCDWVEQREYGEIVSQRIA